MYAILESPLVLPACHTDKNRDLQVSCLAPQPSILVAAAACEYLRLLGSVALRSRAAELIAVSAASQSSSSAASVDRANRTLDRANRTLDFGNSKQDQETTKPDHRNN